MIPAGILLGNGILLGFYAVTGAWNLWAFLWPLEPLVVFVSIAGAFWLAARGDQRAGLTRQVAQRLIPICFVALALVAGLAALPFG